MSLNTILQRLALGISFSACSSPFEGEQYGKDSGTAAENGSSAANQPTDEDCYTRGCPQDGCTFYDDYSGKELDTCRWDVQAGSPYVGDGYLRLARSTIESAWEKSTDSASPEHNSNLLCPKSTTEFLVRQAGTGYAELHLKLDKEVALYAHPLGDLQKRWISFACLSSGTSSPLTPLDMSSWNTIRIEVDRKQEDTKQNSGQQDAGQAELYRNGTLIGSVSCPKPVRPGRISLQGFGDVAMEIDYIQQWCE